VHPRLPARPLPDEDLGLWEVVTVGAVTVRKPVHKAAFVSPMLATLVKPADHYRTSRPGDWQYERKFDGLRCVAVRNATRVDLFSRNRLSYNARFPEVASALAKLPSARFVLDGELVAFDGDQTSFALLQSSPHPEHLTYCVFDLLHLDGWDTTGLGLTERQARLAATLGAGHAPLSLVRPLDGRPADLLDRACGSGWEGLIAKRIDSPYRSGRSPDWQKLKCTASQELVIGGWTEPARSRVGLGALLVGYYDDHRRLRYAGKVGTGFSNQLLVQLHQDLLAREMADSPFADLIREKGAHWARPELVGAVAFTEWTTDGRLRHPSFQGLRPDKPAREVRRESPA
jgi:bifunctional non-homologous end joining protein LigD